MSRFNTAAALLLALAALALPNVASADPEVVLCDVIKANCPKTYSIIELPDATAPQLIRDDEAFLLYQECRGTKAGLNCTAWPQEVGTRGHLRYQWTIEARSGVTTLPAGVAFNQPIACRAGEQVTATLTIANGKYRASASETYTCGKVAK